MSGYRGVRVLPGAGVAPGRWHLRDVNAARISDAWPAVPYLGYPTPLFLASRDGATSFWSMDQQESADVSYRNAVLLDSPVAYWRMGGLLEDELGQHDGGHISGTSEVGGPLGGDSLATDYSNGSSEVPYHPDLNQIGDTITVEFWLWADSLVENCGVMGVVASQSWSNPGWSFYIRSTAGAALAWTINGSSTYRKGDIVTGQWHHIVCRLDGGVGRVYQDGQVVGTDETLGSIGDASSTAMILGALGGLGNFDGKLSEVAIYDYALPEDRVLNHFDAGRELLDSLGGNNLALIEEAQFGDPIAYLSQVALIDGRFESTHFDARLDDVSLECWVRLHGGSGTDDVLYNGDETATGYGLRVVDGVLGLGLGASQGALSGSPEPELQTPVHVVLTRDAGTWHLYVDGQDVATGTDAPTALGGSDLFSVHASERVDVDAAAFYPRALSPEEVVEHYEGGAGLWRPEPRWAGPSEFSYTGTVQEFEVESGTGEVIIECWGAQGGCVSWGDGGGLGGYTKARLAVTPGETLHVYVGGTGEAETTNPLPGGWNGGGSARLESSGVYGASGGGASDVRRGGTDLEARVVVAGGGGGTGGRDGSSSFPGGDGGDLAGGDGTPSGSYTGGGGGDQVAGGSKGESSSYSQPGALGEGGDQTGDSGGWNAAGGGGGYYGGGSGGALGAGGGGGSGYADPAAMDVVMGAGVREGAGRVVITPH